MHHRFRLGMLLWLSIAPMIVQGNVVRNEDICGVQNGRRLYLELGEKGILYAKNVSMVRNEARKGEGTLVYTSNSSHAQCSLELVTCPSCVIIVTFQTIALSHHCGDGTITMDSPCRCDYVWISEPPYEDVSGTPFCGLYAPITYRSSTRTLSITLFYSQSHMHAFTLEYTAERNRLHLKGTELTGQAAKGLNNTGGGILTSPFFPARYPRDLGLEYVVTCPNEASSCRIRLLFSDFQLATVSIMEFYDWNGQRLDVSSGARFRPPVIMSSGPSLLIRFYANGGTGLGYKAFYSFVIGHSLDKSVKPITDCGGYVENLGGAITMMDMVGEGVKTYDCVWLIRPPKNFLHLKTHMYLKVITFADMAGNTELVVKQGPTSALLPLEILRHPANQVQPRYREHVAPVASGFHVSLRGTFGPSSHLAIAYAAFSYMDCFAGSDFLCRNHRCIPSQLNCDGFDHCGDNSDEPATCFRDWEMEDQAEDRKWHANKANYYFPKIDRYPDLKTATLVFVASSLGLIILISALIILLYRMGARARQQRELQSRLQTISELLVFDIADGARIDEISVTDDPPVYEAPPGYDEVVKLGFDSEMIGRKKRRMFRGRNSPSSLQGSSLEVGGGRSSVCSIIEAGTSSGNQDPEISSKNHAIRLPESPPPPYVTPPGSISRHFSVSGLLAADSNASVRDDEDDEDDNDNDDRKDGKEEEERTGERRNWFRRSNDRISSSAPEDGNLNRGSYPDVQVLGAYPRIRHSWNSIGPHSIGSRFDFQRRSLRVLPIETKPASFSTAEARKKENKEKGVEESADPEERPSRDKTSTTDGVRSETGCSCEGACGCATVIPADFEGSEIRARKGKEEKEEEEQAEQEQEQEEEDEEEEEEEEERGGLDRARSTIVKLLKRQNLGGNSGGSSAASTSSTPCGTFRRSMRKLSVCARDRYLGRTSATVGSMVGSYEKLSNGELETAIRRHLHASDPATIDSWPERGGVGGNYRRYSSCDLESLYEGIRILDGFLARRGLTVSHPRRKKSVTVMLFGTPEHGPIHRRRRTQGIGNEQAAIREIGRVSRLSLDAAAFN